MFPVQNTRASVKVCLLILLSEASALGTVFLTFHCSACLLSMDVIFVQINFYGCVFTFTP